MERDYCMTAEIVVKRITVAEVREILIALVESDPERVDPRTVDDLRPRYLGLDNAPNCLVAHLLIKIGFDEHLLRQLDHEFPLGNILDAGVRISESRHPAVAEFDPKALALLDYLQDCQDGGLPWMDCYLDAFAKPSRFIPMRYVRERRPWLF